MTTANILENVVSRLEKYDDIAKRQPFFVARCNHNKEN
jgi:hypothetical protein